MLAVGLGALEPVDDNEDDAINVDSEHMVKGSAICNCPKDCDVTEYSTEMSWASLDTFSVLLNRLSSYVPKLMALEDEINQAELEGRIESAKLARMMIEDYKTTTSLVHIYFKQLGIVKYIRDERYGIMDVICTNIT